MTETTTLQGFDGTDDDEHDDDGRPDDCLCWDADGDLACWPCYREGFRAPNPEEPAAEEGQADE